MNKYAAVDLGAESGRIIVGGVADMKVVHRFSTGPVRIGDSIYWDFLGIFGEIKRGLAAAFSSFGSQIVSIGVDTWGVDFGLLDKDGDLIGNPYHYRDQRTDNIPDEVFKSIPLEDVYKETGIQFMQLNTLYQLYAFSRAKPELLKQARQLLTIPGLINYWLTGIMKNEYTHVTTTQLYNPVEKAWSKTIQQKLGFPGELFGDIVAPGTIIGPLQPHIAKEIGAGLDVNVVATASHDTASAVAAVPAPGVKDFAYLSSGTWSLLGIESPSPIITDKSLEYNFTNEGGADGGIRFLKNIMGLWIMQECKRHWDNQGADDSYDDLTDLAEDSGPADYSLDVDDDRFLKPSLIDDNMPDRVQAYCRESKQAVPETKGQIIRGILEGLAGKYKDNIRNIEEITGRKINQLNIVGGGSKNIYLCKLSAQTTGLPVYAGPKEATAIGNILIQAVSMGEIKDIDTGRSIIRDSYEVVEYLP